MNKQQLANKIWELKIKEFNDAIDKACAKYDVTLTQYQHDALVSCIYRLGYGLNQNYSLVKAYKDGGNAAVWNYMKETYNKNPEYVVGTKKRLAEEYQLFVEGDYEYDPFGSTGLEKYNAYCQNPNKRYKTTESDLESDLQSGGTKIFIGDSRTVAMYGYLFGWDAEAVNKGTVDKNKDIWSAKSAMGLEWMKSTGVPNIEKSITKGTKVIILMGVNDLYDKNEYVTYINQKANEWTKKGAKVYFVSVNPVDEVKEKKNGYSVKNSTIEDFNTTLKNGLNANVKYIDTYNQIKSNFETTDGVHYTQGTSNLIYKTVCNYVKSH